MRSAKSGAAILTQMLLGNPSVVVDARDTKVSMFFLARFFLSHGLFVFRVEQR